MFRNLYLGCKTVHKCSGYFSGKSTLGESNPGHTLCQRSLSLGRNWLSILKTYRDVTFLFTWFTSFNCSFNESLDWGWLYHEGEEIPGFIFCLNFETHIVEICCKISLIDALKRKYIFYNYFCYILEEDFQKRKGLVVVVEVNVLYQKLSF